MQSSRDPGLGFCGFRMVSWVPEWYPFALFILGAPYILKPNSRKKGTLVLKRLLMSQVSVWAVL